MSRINTNISSLQAITTLNRNQNDLSVHLQRLSTGLQINSGKDAPAGLIASESLKSEIAGINQAIDNTQRAGNVVNTAEGALSEVSSLLLEVQTLTNQSANTGAESPDEIAANQLQVDSILSSINRISNTTQFNGVKLLNGSLDYTTSGIQSTAISVAQINAAQLPDNGSNNVVVQVTGSAQLGEVDFTGTSTGTSAITVEVAGVAGTEQLSFAANTATSSVALAVNQLKGSTGVERDRGGWTVEVHHHRLRIEPICQRQNHLRQFREWPGQRSGCIGQHQRRQGAGGWSDRFTPHRQSGRDPDAQFQVCHHRRSNRHEL